MLILQRPPKEVTMPATANTKTRLGAMGCVLMAMFDC
jgi:hypothetical protein